MKSFRCASSVLCLLAFILTAGLSCRNRDPVPLQISFEHYLDGNPLSLSSMQYVNRAGNHYQVDELQYFVSEIKFYRRSGKVAVAADNAIHYVDLAIPSTLTWSPGDKLPRDTYDSISFVFGIVESKNKTGLFVNPPERDMFWPELMGGGYHYMKMNGKWLAAGDTVKAFNFHLGIGMDMMGGTKRFVQNCFTVKLPLVFTSGGAQNIVTFRMNIEKWFEAPNLWDWNLVGGHIMQNQPAMVKACQNGANAFEVYHYGVYYE